VWYKGIRIKSDFYYEDEPHYVPLIGYHRYKSLLSAKQAITKYLNTTKAR
jgi:hypothetical protein